MTSATRPLPVPSELTAPFWEAAAQRTLVRPYCSACDASFFTPQIACPRCLSEGWTWLASTGRGVVYSYTVCHRAPVPGFDAPYVLAIVDVEEGWTILSNIVGCEPHDVRIAMPVSVTWLPAGGEITLPVFEPSS